MLKCFEVNDCRVVGRVDMKMSGCCIRWTLGDRLECKQEGMSEFGFTIKIRDGEETSEVADFG